MKSVFEQKTAGNKIFLLKKLVNIKLKKRTLMIDHLNVFQYSKSIGCYKNGFRWWDASLLVTLFIAIQLRNFFLWLLVTLILNGALSMELVKGNLFNEETKIKPYA